MQNTAPPRKRRHIGTWIVVIVAFAEIGVLVAFVMLKDRFPSCQAEISQNILGRLPGGGNTLEGGGGKAAPPPVVPPLAASAPASPEAESAGAGGVKVSGDTNQVPDPKCVGETTAGLLNSGPAPSAKPSCAPMSPPPELKKAEQQLSNGSTSAQTGAPAPTATP